MWKIGKIPLFYSHLFVDNSVESLLKRKKLFLLFIFSTNWVTLVVIYLSCGEMVV